MANAVLLLLLLLLLSIYINFSFHRNISLPIPLSFAAEESSNPSLEVFPAQEVSIHTILPCTIIFLAAISPYDYLSICLSIYLPIHPSIYLTIHPSIHLSIHLPIYLSIYLSIIYLSNYPPIPPVRRPVRPSINLTN